MFCHIVKILEHLFECHLDELSFLFYNIGHQEHKLQDRQGL